MPPRSQALIPRASRARVTQLPCTRTAGIIDERVSLEPHGCSPPPSLYLELSLSFYGFIVTSTDLGIIEKF